MAMDIEALAEALSLGLDLFITKLWTTFLVKKCKKKFTQSWHRMLYNSTINSTYKR